MTINITMPALSPTMEEGNLAKWNVKEGDTVSAGDVIAEIETDKATMEVESIDEGVVGKILVEEGAQNVKVNTVIAVLLEDGESASDISDVAAAPAAAPAAAAAPAKEEPKAEAPAPKTEPGPSAAPALPTAAAASKANGERTFASPLARRLAKEASIDVTLLSGTGPKGRVVKRDIEKALREGVPQAAPAATASAAPSLSSGMADKDVIGLYEEGTYDLVANDGMRKVIAARLTEAKQTVPHFYISMDVRLDDLLEARARINATAKKDENGRPEFKLSVNDFIMKAWAMALQEVPDANASWAGEHTLKHHHSDIAVAVSVPGGLFTPVVKKAEQKSLREISAEVKDLAKRAKSKKLAPHEYQGGSSSVSNLGMFGVTNFQAVINPPHGSILAVGAGEERVVVENGEIAVGNFMTVTMSCDHRVVDGVLGAQALGVFKQLIETPVMMLA
ncbi:pyruvate dehydrogenase complex dihydrolipoamide acetyltransferase [Maritalea porphyrae]|uniref:Acetyltransferase component of pyruvate dehydrogenase complex n=1 Tax=Maritalea porphyrae TaxID=880732 RepID=A0ABQ5UT45_9HYPH|nr:pyruvate dehydrogenase complex dihydrolipoamide acetyltransferase [Maritalea porphyrae]GLQ18454.1 acetyltransferase component of pyruvate dehydrogenase complex [Maritalea porphyrae]